MTKGQPDFPAALIRAVRERRLIPFVGPGVAHQVRDALGGPLLPSWHALLERVADRLGAAKRREEFRVRTYLDLEPPDVISAIRHGRKGLGVEWEMFLAEELDPPRSLVVDSSLELGHALWSMGCPLIITVLYDRVLDWTCPDVSMMRRWVISPPTHDLEKLWASLTVPHLWHLYGHVDHVRELIITPDGYEPVFPEQAGIEARWAEALEVVRDLASARPLLFLGFSQDDKYTVGQLRRARELLLGVPGPHYAFVREADVQRFREATRGVDLELITFAEYGTPLVDLVESLAATLEGAEEREPDAPTRPRDRERSDITAALVAELTDVDVPMPEESGMMSTDELAASLPEVSAMFEQDIREVHGQPSGADEQITGSALMQPSFEEGDEATFEELALDDDDDDEHGGPALEPLPQGALAELLPPAPERPRDELAFTLEPSGPYVDAHVEDDSPTADDAD
ncbi:MAG: SIR2 family protein, partial [Myxococcales bacterium]|nr:SIR2 family protein [Myxococcales bacterium]